MRRHSRYMVIATLLVVGTTSMAVAILQSNHRARLQGAAPITTIVVSPDGDTVAVCRELMVSARNGDRGDYTLYRSADLHQLFSIAGGPIRDFAFVPGESRAVILEASSLKLIDLQNQRIIWTQSGHDNRIESIAVLHDARVVLATESSYDGKIVLFSLDDGKPIGDRDHDRAGDLLVASDDNWYSLGNGKLCRWHSTDEQPVAEIDITGDGITQEMALIPGGGLVVAITEQPVRVYDAATLELQYALDSPIPIGFLQLVTVPGKNEVIIVSLDDYQLLSLPAGKVLSSGRFPNFLSACSQQLVNQSLIIGYNSRRLQQTVEIHPIE